ncbi:distal tail protein Dit [Priestia megaterium]|uniref:distal tail protein Dit n=1 Tax=Priestia megaterium TaxID=1404 RepID=UPI003CFF6A58
MESKILSFGGVPTPSFLIVEKVDLPPLASSIVSGKDIPMKSGKLFANQKFDSRTIPVDLALIAPSKDEYQETCALMAEWLYSKKPQPIVFSERPDITYMAILEGGTDFTQFRELGRGTINLICHDPHGFGVTRNVAMDLTKELTPIINQGNMETSPIIDLTINKNVTDFFIATSDRYYYFGEPLDPTEKTPVDLSPTIMNDGCSTLQNWLQVTDWSVDGGVLRGAGVSSNGFSFGQGSTDGKTDYGTASGLWHGSSAVYSLDQEVQDFEIEAEVHFQATDKKQKGRIELYFLDSSNRKLGKMAIRDYDSGLDNPIFECRLGAMNEFNRQIQNTYGDKKGVFKNFHGVIRIGRRGRQWSTFIAKTDGINDYTARRHKSITDTWNKFSSSKVAKIQIHFAAYGNDPAVDQMRIDNIKVDEFLPKQTGKVDYLFKKNDKLHINCETGEILRNGTDATNTLYIGSQALKFPKGVSGVTVSDPSIFSSGTVRFTERWL